MHQPFCHDLTDLSKDSIVKNLQMFAKRLALVLLGALITYLWMTTDVEDVEEAEEET